MKSCYAYIMAIGRNGTLYAGSTSDLIKRTWEHNNNVTPGFTAKYNVHILVYYPHSAIEFIFSLDEAKEIRAAQFICS